MFMLCRVVSERLYFKPINFKQSNVDFMICVSFYCSTVHKFKSLLKTNPS